MVEKIFCEPEIFKIYVPLPDNPLKNLNCYVICSMDESLIIDTGFCMNECYEAMRRGLCELGIDLNSKKTSLFLTHLHSDHIGLAAKLMPKNSLIYMSKIDYEYLKTWENEGAWEKTEDVFCTEGFPKEAIGVLRETNPARSYAPEGPFDAVTLVDGDIVRVGIFDFLCILTPGHTPGHMCLYLKEKGLMILGDHVLFDITPNITSWLNVEDSLNDYLTSLKKIKIYDVETALPAHRKNDKNFYVRVDEILEHHKVRLENTYQAVSEKGGMTAYEIAEKLKWSMRGRDWSEFPMHQKWFAVGETLSHLDYLKNRGMIQKKLIDGIFRYETGQK